MGKFVTCPALMGLIAQHNTCTVVGQQMLVATIISSRSDVNSTQMVLLNCLKFKFNKSSLALLQVEEVFRGQSRNARHH